MALPALIGAAIISSIGNLFGNWMAGNSQKNAARNAANAQLASTQMNIQFQKWLFDQQKDLNEPWMQAGLEALQKLGDMPEFFAQTDFEFNPDEFLNDPSYSFRLNEGLKSLEHVASARGQVLSGAEQKAAMQYSSGLASQEYQNAWARAFNTFQSNFKNKLAAYNTNRNNLLQVANLGRGATASLQNAGAQLGSQVGAAYTNMGNAQANMWANIGNANAGMWQNFGNVVDNFANNWAFYNLINNKRNNMA